LLDKILEERQKHIARVVVKDYGARKGKLWVHGEIQLTIPLNFYYEYMSRYKRNYGKLYGGIDVNVDRVNLVIVDKYGRLRDNKTFWFEDATRKGYSRRKAKVVIGMAIHNMLRYAYHHGVKTLFLENPEVLGKLRLLWIRNSKKFNKNYNWKVAVFRSRTIEMITMKAPLYAINTVYVDPKGTTHSREHDEVMREYGLDKHTASAYLIALRGIERHTMIQKAIN